MADPGIYYLQNHQIDKQAWDECLRKSANGLIYGYTYYLDSLCSWDGIIMDDYKAVMPLPWRKKYGIRYVYPPAFVQQLGVFSSLHLEQNTITAMLELGKKYFRFGEYFFNYGNRVEHGVPKTNYILDLRSTYEEIKSRYKTVLVKNLKKAAKHPVRYITTDDYRHAVNLSGKTYGHRIPHVKGQDYLNFIGLCSVLSSKNQLVIRELKNGDDLLASVLLLNDNRRLYLLLSTTTKQGRPLEAAHYLIDSVIREFAGRQLLLDFEGSDIAGIAYLYESFGALNQPYHFHRWNNLPWPLRLLKK